MSPGLMLCQLRPQCWLENGSVICVFMWTEKHSWPSQHVIVRERLEFYCSHRWLGLDSLQCGLTLTLLVKVWSLESLMPLCGNTVNMYVTKSTVAPESHITRWQSIVLSASWHKISVPHDGIESSINCSQFGWLKWFKR